MLPLTVLQKLPPRNSANGAAPRDAQTLQLLQAAAEEGLSRLLADHGGRVLGALRRQFHGKLDELALTEALNQAAMRVWRTERIDPKEVGLGRWFYAIARNCACRIIASRQRNDVELIREADEHIDRKSADVGYLSFQRDLYRCVRELPHLQREVLLADLAAGGAVPAARLARDLETSVNSIYVSRTNGRSTVRTRMRALGHDVLEPTTPWGRYLYA
jgi:DNA-directed RNA polymerase specialized sigma24 family protein